MIKAKFILLIYRQSLLVGSPRRIENGRLTGPGTVHDILFSVDLERVVIDEMHLLGRIMDRLEDGLIHDVWHLDEVYKCSRT